MPTLVEAESRLFERVVQERWQRSDRTLTAAAFSRFQLTQRRTTWGRRCQRTSALLEGDTLLASADHFAMSAVFAGQPVRVCGIGSVWTRESRDAVDDARQLIDGLLEDAGRDGADMALLFGPAAGASAAHGWFVVQSQDLTLHVAAPPRYGAPMTLVRGGEERDLAAIVGMGRIRAERFRFHLDRDVDFLQHVITSKRLLAGLGAAHARQLHFFIAEEGITAAAYVIISVVGQTWTLEECGDRDPSGARVGALLQALIAREPAEGRPAIRAWLPSGFLPPQITIADARPSADVVRVRRLGAKSEVWLSDGDVLYWHNDVL